MHQIYVLDTKIVRAVALLCPRLEEVSFFIYEDDDDLMISFPEFEYLLANHFREVIILANMLSKSAFL